MNHVVLVLLYTKDFNEILLLFRRNNPYKGLYNGIGGKVDVDESISKSVIREIEEELSSKHLPDILYKLEKYTFNTVTLHVYYSFVKKFEPPKCDEGILKWFPVSFINETNPSVVNDLFYFTKVIKHIHHL